MATRSPAPICSSTKRSSAVRVRARLSAARCTSSTKKKMTRPRAVERNATLLCPLEASARAPPVVATPAASSFASSSTLPAITPSKNENSTGRPSTRNSNCSRPSPSTARPRLSTTVTSVCTSSALTRTTSSACVCLDSCRDCPTTTPAATNKKPSI
jgi:hypothetical protein